jgi:hypothetical protein
MEATGFTETPITTYLATRFYNGNYYNKNSNMFIVS